MAATDRCNLIVNYLPPVLTDSEFETMFKSIGELKSYKIVRDKVTGANMGYGFIEYQNEDDAQRAIDTLNGLQLQNKRLRVAYSKPTIPATVPYDTRTPNLYVSGLPMTLSEAELTALFTAYGKITQVRVLINPITKCSRCVGFVRFSTNEEAQSAVSNVNGTMPAGFTAPIKVKFAEEGQKKATAKLPMVGGGIGPGMFGMNMPFGGMGMMGMGAAGMGFGNGMGMGFNDMGGPMGGMFGQGGFGGMGQFGMNQFGVGYQGGAGGGPMRGGGVTGNQMRQRFDPMSRGTGVMGAGGMMNGVGAMMGGMGTPGNFTLFAYNIGADTDEQALTALFQQFGTVQKATVIRDQDTMVSKGYGFVTMIHAHEAMFAIQSLNGFTYKDKPLQVSLKQQKTVVPPVPTSGASATVEYPTAVATTTDGTGFVIFVYNIGMDATEKTLYMLFHSYGAIQRVNVVRSKESNVCKGFGFVTMADLQSAQNAIQALNGFMFNGRQLQVKFKDEKNAGNASSNGGNDSTAASCSSNGVLSTGALYTSFYGSGDT